jgi:integrase/recombinase XerC
MHLRLSALFESFCSYLRVEKEAAIKTISTYRDRFEDFTDFVRREIKEEPIQTIHFTTEVCRAYQYELDARELNPNTIRGRLATLSSFGRWAVLRGKIKSNPIDQLTRPRRKRSAPKGVPQWSVVEAVLSNGLNTRDKAIVALLSYGGLRRSEVVALNVGDFDPLFGIRRVQGKGGDEDAVALPEVACRILASYLAEHRSEAKPSDPLFVVKYLTRGRLPRERRMVDGRVYKIIKRLGVAHELPELHPHALRHAVGVELLERSGGDLRVVQEHLRHADIQTTTQYTRLMKPRLKRAMSVFDRAGDPTPPPAGDEPEAKKP